MTARDPTELTAFPDGLVQQHPRESLAMFKVQQLI